VPVDAEPSEEYAPPPRKKPARGRGALDLPPAQLRVRTFGAVEVARAGVPLDAGAWETASARDLFLYLVDHPEGSTRDEILTGFWPESTTPRATSTFHTTLHRIRRALGRSVVDRQADRYYVSVPEGLDYDVVAFEAAIKRASHASGDAVREHLEEAAELYRGEYLPGVEMDWARERAENLGVAATAAFMELAKLYLDAGEAEPAAVTYQRAAALAPLEEEAHRGVMLAYAKGGDRVKALQAYDRLAAILEAELGVEPDETSQALRRAIKGREQPAA
jgi:two-component SAPR family response regulator